MIECFCGYLGHGKTHTLTERGLRLANEQKKEIVTNMHLKVDELEVYARNKGLHWVAACARRGRIFHDADLNRMFSYEGVVLMIDELGIFANSRKMVGQWAQFERFFFDLILSRKAGIDLLWTAQDHEMVDKNIRRLTNYYWHTYRLKGEDVPLPFFGKNKDVKFITKFTAGGYQRWLATQDRFSWAKNKLEWRLEWFDSSLFNVYDTLQRLDNSETYSLAAVAEQLGGQERGKMIVVPPAFVPKNHRSCPAEVRVAVRLAQLEKERILLVGPHVNLQPAGKVEQLLGMAVDGARTAGKALLDSNVQSPTASLREAF